MKVKVEEQPKGFRPVTMEVTFESREELEYMWNALNAPGRQVKEQSLKYGSYPLREDLSEMDYPLWHEIDEVLENL